MPEPVSIAPRRPAGLRVLVADDNPDTVLTLSALLADDGHEVRALQEGAGVPQHVAAFDPDVCIFDIEMPGRNGYRLARELRDRRIGPRPLLVALSGAYVRPADRFLALMVGFDHFFQKPADPRELARVLDDYRRGRKAIAMHERVHLARG